MRDTGWTVLKFLCLLAPFDIGQPNQNILIPTHVIDLKIFLNWISFATTPWHCRDYSINLDCLFARSVRRFVALIFLGQRNPLTADMSSEIWVKVSFGIIITSAY